VHRRAHTLLASAGIAALVLSGCTPGESGPQTDPSGDAGNGQADSAPVVTVVNDALEADTAAAGGTMDASSDSTDASTATSTPESDGAESDDTDAQDTGTVMIGAGQELELAVDGGVFTEVRLIDADHDTVPVDTGTFDVTAAGSDDQDATAEATDPSEPSAGGTVETPRGLVDAESDDEE
jgi:hypothetical protein